MKVVHIVCLYFRKNGKFYTRGSSVYDKKLFQKCKSPRDCGIVLRNLKRCPGLISGIHHGTFMIMVNNSKPELVLPEVGEKKEIK